MIRTWAALAVAGKGEDIVIRARLRLAAAGLLGAMALGTVAAPVAGAAPPRCQVRNVTQGTAGGSLRAMADAAGWGDVLTVRGTCPGPLTIVRGMTIRGIGDRRAVVTGGDRPPAVLRITEGVHVTLRHVVITGSTEWGGILNDGHVTLVDSVVRGNGQVIGGILNGGTMRLVRSRVQGNHAWDGGGIYNGGTMVLRRTVVSGNNSWDGSGGGIANGGTLTLIHSSVRGNVTMYIEGGGDGGGILNWGRVVVRASSVTRNRADGGFGGGIHNTGSLIIRDSTVTRNSAKKLAGEDYEHGGSGGGIWTQSPHPARLVGSTVTGNTAEAEGGGIVNRGALVLVGSEVSANTAGRTGGGIWNDDGPGSGSTVTLSPDATVTGNSPDDCVGTPAC